MLTQSEELFDVADVAVVSQLIADNSVDFLDYIRWEDDQVCYTLLVGEKQKCGEN